MAQSNESKERVWATENSDLLYFSLLWQHIKDHAKECRKRKMGKTLQFSTQFLHQKSLFLRNGLQSLTKSNSGVTKRQILTLSKKEIDYSSQLCTVRVLHLSQPPWTFLMKKTYHYKIWIFWRYSFPQFHETNSWACVWHDSNQWEGKAGPPRGFWDWISTLICRKERPFCLSAFGHNYMRLWFLDHQNNLATLRES